MTAKGQKQLYHKLFFNYTIVILCIVMALMAYFISATKARIRETNLDYMKMMSEKAVSYLEESEDITGNINNELYQTGSVLDDLLHFLRCGEEEYQKYRLDTFMGTSSLVYVGYDRFVENALQAYPSIVSIGFISYGKSQITSCYPNGKKTKILFSENSAALVENGSLNAEGEFSFSKKIRDPQTMEIIGSMIVTFRSDLFSDIHKYYDSELIILNKEGNFVFRSEIQYSPQELTRADSEETLETYLAAYVLKKEVQDFSIYTFLGKTKAVRLPLSLYLTIIGIGILAAALGGLAANYHLKRLAKRLDYILEGMEKVTTGDLSVHLNADHNGDELDVISGNFNDMCRKLERYIQKSYLAEIEQKNAEMEILKNQINPHFLYNTLEAIRMKAICNGDRDVGKMLYSMAVIFRSQLKDADVITVIQEIHYCKKYIELFQYRYQEEFTSEVICPEALMKYPIIKFILQPVIENYFVHGIRQEAGDNEIKILVEKKEEDLLIHVTDNGRGMEEERMAEKNRQLEAGQPDAKKAMGFMNVNKRIKAVYGEMYGIKLEHSETNGLHVIVKVGAGENEDNNESTKR